MTRKTPELGTPSPSFHATPTCGRLATTYDLACNRPHIRWIFSGIGFRTRSPSAPKPRPYHYATADSAAWSQHIILLFPTFILLLVNFLSNVYCFFKSIILDHLPFVRILTNFYKD
ncbi:hypothetical protein AVEN_58891-1 [Araneus ventricosus]|uniref:Uncharacterized protein n=1 Tax=Araneus ventricosus TaxID=182803 RepID=A0A4Y2R571_ARAVE|nr:hypothetical protein AVEN_151883-1 [Araneus ventricosus]GBN70643.1 hypothetical protein AVEN_58891-1 [Araneus ventricosus]